MKIITLLTKTKAIYLLIVLLTAFTSYSSEIRNILSGKSSDGAYEIQIIGIGFSNVTSYSLNNPSRIIIDVPKGKSILSKKVIRFNSPIVSNVAVIEGDDKSRVVVNMVKDLPYKLIKNSNKISVILNYSSKTSSNSNNLISKASVKFARTQDGQGKVNIKLPSKDVSVDVYRTGRNVVARLIGAKFGDSRRLNVQNFGTPVSSIDVYGNKLKINSATDRFKIISYQNDSDFVIEFNKPKEVEINQNNIPPGDARRKYTGKPLSLNFQDIEVRSVLQIIGDFTKTNIVVSGEVKGNITLRLNNVPWDQALDIILQTKGLSMQKNGNIIYVAPSGIIAKNLEDNYKISTVKQDLAPLQQELIQIQYARADRLYKILETERNLKNGSGVAKSSLLSSRGRITVDKRTNTLIIDEVPSNLEKIRKLVSQLDKPVSQVLIDSRIVSATDDFAHQLGIKWGASGRNDKPFPIAGTHANAGISGSLSGIPGNSDSIPSVELSNDINDRLGVNLAASNPVGSLALKLLGRDYLLDMELSAMESNGSGEVISSPRVVAQDGNRATIKSGREIAYTTRGKDGDAKVTFKPILLSLDVTPKIAPDNKIDMILKVNKDTIGNLTQTIGGVIPSINKNSVETQVLVDNGETVVLGGIYEQTKTKSISKVPLLGDIPIIGRAFRRDENKTNKSELLIFVTPKIIDKKYISRDKFIELRN